MVSHILSEPRAHTKKRVFLLLGRDGLALVVVVNGGGERRGVHVEALRHLEAPLVLDLAAQVQVQLRDQQAIADARETLPRESASQ